MFWLNGLFQKKSKLEAVEYILFWTPLPLWISRFVTLPLVIPEKTSFYLCKSCKIVWHPLEIQDQPRPREIQGVYQKIKTADVFSKLGNETSVYQRLPPCLTTRKTILVQPIEHWKIPSCERNISEEAFY